MAQLWQLTKETTYCWFGKQMPCECEDSDNAGAGQESAGFGTQFVIYLAIAVLLLCVHAYANRIMRRNKDHAQATSSEVWYDVEPTNDEAPTVLDGDIFYTPETADDYDAERAFDMSIRRRSRSRPSIWQMPPSPLTQPFSTQIHNVGSQLMA